MTYFYELRVAMAMLAAEPKTLFVGQGVLYDNHALYRTLQDERGEPIVPMEQRIELPVVEEFQMGYCTGLAMAGFLPICIYPRWDFLLLAANQLVNHLDKIPYTTFDAKVIIRVGVGAKYPLDSGKQHTQDHSAAFRLMLETVEVIELNSKFDIAKGYRHALETPDSCILVERQDLYNA